MIQDRGGFIEPDWLNENWSMVWTVPRPPTSTKPAIGFGGRCCRTSHSLGGGSRYVEHEGKGNAGREVVRVCDRPLSQHRPRRASPQVHPRAAWQHLRSDERVRCTSNLAGPSINRWRLTGEVLLQEIGDVSREADLRGGYPAVLRNKIDGPRDV